jgi:N-acetyl sugar amidotransferase
VDYSFNVESRKGAFMRSIIQKEGTLDAKYGLPQKVLFCKRCVISNQRPNSVIEFKHTKDCKKPTIKFDKEFICDACRAAENKIHAIDWQDREKELIELCNKHRSKDGSYDCLISGSGGKDSFYTSHMLKYKYDMNPLTVTWAPHIYTEWGWKNFQAWIHAGFDNHLFTPNGKVHRLLTRLALENLLHPFQPFILGQKNLAPKIAAMYDISLVFYGENEAEYGNPIKDMSSAKRDWSFFAEADRSKFYIAGTSIADLVNDYDLKEGDLEPYLPTNPDCLLGNEVEVRYLGYYLRWHPQGAYYYSVENGEFQAAPERSPGTYSKYNSIDDKIDDFHYYTLFIKFGIGRASYDAAQEIRNEEITREEGVALVKKYDGEYPERFADEIYQYLSISEKQYPVAHRMFDQPIVDRKIFMALVDQFRSPHLWKYEDGEWKLRFTVSNH